MKASEAPLSALILASRRNADGDPLDSYADGRGHKAFIEFSGKLLIERVLSALDTVEKIKEKVIAAPDDVRGGIEALQTKHENIRFTAPSGTPARTIGDTLPDMPKGAGLLVTTCDHALLTGDMVREFLSNIDVSEVDTAVACVTRDVYEAAYPNTSRTFIKLKDFEFSGANLFWLNAEKAQPLAAYWRRIEEKRKNPGAMALEIGLWTGFRYLSGGLSKRALIKRIHEKTGVRADFVALSSPEAAIDVDKPEDIETVNAILSNPCPNSKYYAEA